MGRKMKLTTALLATTANACINQPTGPAAPENFVQSGRVDWTLLMDNVMGGISSAPVNSVSRTMADLLSFTVTLDASLPATTQCDFRLVRLIPLAIFMRHIHVIWERE